MFPSRRTKPGGLATGGGAGFRDEYSLAFDGTNEYIVCDEVTYSNDITISAWVKPNFDNSTSTIKTIISVGGQSVAADASFFWMYIQDDDFRVQNANTNADEYSNSRFDNMHESEDYNKWTHWVVVWDISESLVAKVYKNGVDLGSANSVTNPGAANAATDARVSIGMYYNLSSHPWGGNISEIAIYDKVLSASQVATLYNGREPYNHKEGIATANLKAWYRMGDGALDGYPLITDSSTTTSLGTDLIPNSTCDDNITGWSDYSSGAVSHETSITYSGSGALRCTFDGNNHWGGMTTDNIASVQADTLYLVEAWIYIPSGYDGGPCYLSDGTGFTNATAEEHLKADENITNEWQYTRLMFRTLDGTTGKLYVRTSGSDPSDTKYVIVDNITMRPVTGGNPGHTYNMATDNFEGDTP